MKIDAHAHACGYYDTTEHILEKLDEFGLDKVVLFPGEPGKKVVNIQDMKRKEVLYVTNVIGEFLGRFINFSRIINARNSDVYGMRMQAPDKIIQYYWATPEYLHRLEADYRDMKFAGIKVHQCIKYFSIKSPFFMRIVEFAEINNLPVLIHLYGKKDAKKLIEVVKNRKVKVIVAHLFHWKIFKSAWAEVKNQIWFDMANYYFLNRETIINAIGSFGSEKLIFGSDNPFGENCIGKTLELVNNLPVSIEDKRNILGDNLLSVLGKNSSIDQVL